MAGIVLPSITLLLSLHVCIFVGKESSHLSLPRVNKYQELADLKSINQGKRQPHGFSYITDVSSLVFYSTTLHLWNLPFAEWALTICVLTGRDPKAATCLEYCSAVCPEERYFTLAVFLHTLWNYIGRGVGCGVHLWRISEVRRGGGKVLGCFAK